MGAGGNALRALDKRVRASVLQTIKNASDDIQSNGRDVVRRWRTKVDFKEELTVTPHLIVARITPKGKGAKIFGYLDLGTKGPYLIPKVLTPGKMLTFRTGYSAMTAPVAKYNVGSGQSFGGWRRKAQVTHPGIKKREFLKTFMNELVPTLQARAQTDIDRSV